MHKAVKKMANEAGWRLRSLFRMQPYFYLSELMQLYKSLVLSYLEAYTPAILHAAPSLLGQLDWIQNRLLDRMNLTQLGAFQHYNLHL